jgi:cell division transport system ATP-binding protein
MDSRIAVSLRNANIYQEGTLVLNGVNLEIKKGEFCYLIGKTGTGKSSLLKTIYGEIPLKDGEGVVGDFNLVGLVKSKIPFLRRKIGIVFQDFNLLTDRNVSDNLDFVLKATGWTSNSLRKTRIQEVLSAVNLVEKTLEMPYKLSGGEQQRVVIARALLNHPSLILADEPTGNLDPETSDEILTLLRFLSETQQTAVIMATHDYRVMERYPARIVRCFNGKIFEAEELAI